MSDLNLIARSLVRYGLISDERINQILEKTSVASEFYEEIINEEVTGNIICQKFSENFGLAQIDLLEIDTDYIPQELVDLKAAKKHLAIPIYQRDTKLFVAVADPISKASLDELKFKTGLKISAVQASPESIIKLIDKLEALMENTMLSELEGDEDLDGLAELDIVGEDDENNSDQDDSGIDDAPIVKYVNKILMDAIRKGASDIHVEPFEKHLRIRFRMDGVLQEVTKQPINLAGRLAARLKIMAKIDIAEKRAPQDGRMKLRLSKNKAIDFRVNTCPTMYGEKVVIRILSMGAEGLTLEMLGFTEEQQKLYADAVMRPYGMVLITGPTGSGKTVSLYTALGMLNTIDKNISTVEDPVEINMVGVNQVQINERANLDFAAALRAFLRQDPDIIMVGEIRDLTTAEIAIKAAQTGHLVMSTLHTNDAPATLTRLLNMGVPSFNIASSVHLIVAQRLARRLCTKCKVKADIPHNALLEVGFTKEDLKDITIYSPKGCNECTEGYKGRTGIFQVLPVGDDIKSLIMEGCTQKDIEDLAEKNGIMNLRQAGLYKVKEGSTSLEEVERVTNL